MKRKYVPTYEQFYAKAKNENILSQAKQGIQNVGQKIGQALKTGLNWFKSIFSHPMMKVRAIPGGRVAIYTGPGAIQDPNRAPTVGVYDFFTGKTSTTNESRKVRHRHNLLDEKVDYTKGVNLRETLRAMKEYRTFLEAIVPLESPDPEVINIGNDELIELVSDAYEYGTNPVFILGAPGIGKTQIMQHVANKLGIGLIIFNTAIKDPTDFIGLPSLQTKTYIKDGREKIDTSTHFALPAVWPRSNRPDGAHEDGTEKPEDLVGGIIFFDELNVANQAVLNAGLQLLGSRSIDGYKLPSRWTIVAAGNRDDENDIKEFNAALSNRFKIVNFVPEIKKWAEWGSKSYGEDFDDDKKKHDRYYQSGVRTTNVRPEVIAFILTKTDWFHKVDIDMLKANTPWPSPRSWTDASAAIDIAESKKRKKTGNTNAKLAEQEVVSAVSKHVGLTAATEFGAFWTIIDEIVPGQLDMIYTDGANAPLPPGRKKDRDSLGNDQYALDKAHAFGIMAAFHRKNGTVTEEEFSNFVDYTIKVNNRQLANVMLSTLMRNNPHLTPSGTDKKTYVKAAGILTKWAKKYQVSQDELNNINFNIATNQNR